MKEREPMINALTTRAPPVGRRSTILGGGSFDRNYGEFSTGVDKFLGGHLKTHTWPLPSTPEAALPADRAGRDPHPRSVHSQPRRPALPHLVGHLRPYSQLPPRPEGSQLVLKRSPCRICRSTDKSATSRFRRLFSSRSCLSSRSSVIPSPV
jgi:hypothetical protein